LHVEQDGEIFINCPNCVLAVSAELIRKLEHSPDYLFTRQTAASYNPDATSPTFESALQSALPDPGDIDLFRYFCGYILLPDCRHEIALVCFGETGTGKGTVTTGPEAALGPDLVTSIPLVQLCNPQNKNLAKLTGVALNLSSELDAVEVQSEFFKLPVSGEVIDADRKYRDSISLRNTAKLLFSANRLPRFHQGTDAELRRLRFLRFSNKVDTPDETLKERIRGERDGILLLMLEGLRTLLKTHSFPTGGIASVQTREQFKLQNDPVNAFIQAFCELGRDCKISKDDLYAAYKKFCEHNDILHKDDSSWFNRQLRDRYPSIKPSRPRGLNGKRFHELEGITLKAEFELA
jgi:putative DNA primase/helicase